jgi:aconitase B
MPDQPAQQDAQVSGETEPVRITGRRSGKNTAAVEQFNEVCPIGTPVLYWPGVREGEGRKSTTRSAAWLLGGHDPVVMVEGYAGGIALTHVMPYAAEVTS